MACKTLVTCGEETWRQLFGTHTKSKRATPKINGSFGGFVAVIVCLTLVIVVACTAVFFLLRDQRTHDEEHARRRRRNRYQSTSEMQLSTHSEPSARRSWSTRIASIFGRNHTQDNTRPHDISRPKMKLGGVHGWIQAGSVDDWESDSSEDRQARAGQVGIRQVSSPGPSVLSTTSSTTSPVPVSRTTSDSTSSVRFDLHAIRGLQYPERHPSPHSTLPTIHSQLSSPAYSPASSPVPLRTLSPEPIPTSITLDNDIREYSTPSGAVMRTLPGGTKFIEAL